MDGEAVSLVCVDEAGLLRDIQQHLRRVIPSEVVAGFEPDRSVRAEPIRLRSGAAAPSGRSRQQPRAATADRGRRPHRNTAQPGASIGNYIGRVPGGRPGMAAGGPAPSGAHRRAPVDHPGGGRVVALPGERLRRADTGQAIERPAGGQARGRNR